ncbi:MAG TPA: hypothetical protein VE890_15755, partial [Thermoguttaceae bacterium]|nr:hypothetical protein [Thermoguttaceae bacterium]
MIRRTNRRRFLCATLGAVPWLLPHSRSALAEEQALTFNRLQKATERGWALGSTVSMTALHADRATAQRAVARAMNELRLVERVMSLYRPESQ